MARTLVSQIPGPVFASSTLAAARSFDPAGTGFDFAIGGLPFNGAASEQRPVVRATAQMQKQQSDTSREPGEHSLAFWWLKAQSSFHGGAGQKYLGAADSSEDDLSRYRFWESEGLDVFSEPGKVSLLPVTTRIPTTAGMANPLIATSEAGYLYVADGATLHRHWLYSSTDHPNSSLTLYSDEVAWGGTATITNLVTQGNTYYLTTADGVHRGTALGAATKIYNFPNQGTAKPVLAFVKQRLILALSADIKGVYELNQNATASAALPTPVFTGPEGTGWKWTSIAETPTAILLSGEGFQRSAVYKMVLDTSGPVPILSAGVVTAEFPPGEHVRGLTSYLGTVVGVQTSAGFRVGVLDESGDFRYGPLLFEHDWGKGSPGVIGLGNSLYAGRTDEKGIAGLARIDLGSTFGGGQSIRFPWASDLRASDSGSPVPGTVNGLALWEYNRKVFAVPGKGVYYQGRSSVASGYLVTSRIRWDTLEPKLVRFARIRGEGYGRISLELSRNSDTAFAPVGSIDLARQQDSGDMYVQSPPGQFMTLRLTVTGGSLSGYQLKGLPAQRRQRILQIPLNCFDRETDNTGQIVGGVGSAMSRLLALESIEQRGDVVALQWLSVHPDQQLTEYVTIEQVEFAQASGPSDSRGWGGVITLTLRTVE